MDQFSSQLANNLENGYVAGVPEHLIQIYKELSSWCELIQYKIDVDINTQDDIRKQVLSNNLLKHIQGLWQEKVYEFYVNKRDEVRDNLSKAFQNRISNQKFDEDGEMELEPEPMEEDITYQQNIYAMPSPVDDEYFNDNDSLSSEEDSYQTLNNMSTDPSNEGQQKMVFVVKYNASSNSTNNSNSFNDYDDEYDFDYGCNNDHFDFNEYDEYDLHHYKEANVTKVSINCTHSEGRNTMMNNYDQPDVCDFNRYYERPNTPSIPDWPFSYEEEEQSCAADFLSHDSWDSVRADYQYHNDQENQEMNCYNCNQDYNNSMREEEKPEKKEDSGNHLSYTEQLKMEQQKRLNYISFGSVPSDEDYTNSKILGYNDPCQSPFQSPSLPSPQQEIEQEKNTSSDDADSRTENGLNHLSSEFSMLSIMDSDPAKDKESEKDKEDDQLPKLTITIDDSVINNEIEHSHRDSPKVYKEHLYPRTIKSRDLYYDCDDQDSPSCDSIISPNEELLLSATPDDENFEYSSGKVLMTPLSALSSYSYSENLFSPIEEKPEEEELKSAVDLTPEKIVLPTESNNTEKTEVEENINKYLSSRRDSGFSDYCDEPFIVSI